MRTARVCQTHFLAPTNTLGSRVVATHATTRRRVVLPWDHALGQLDNHTAAARELFGAEPAYCASVADGGYVFVAETQS